LHRVYRAVTIGFSVAERHRPVDSFHNRLTAFAREIDDVVGGSVDALHRARVASRRLRELLPLLGLDGDSARKLNRQLRKITRQLGDVRELDVLIKLIDELERSRRYSPAALTTLSQVIGRKRDAARERLAAKLPASKLIRLANRLERAVRSRESAGAKVRERDPIHARRAWLFALDARLARRAARLHETIAMAGALYAPEPLHDVRIALKKLRYTAELSLEAGRLRAAGDVATLKASQDLLGRLHDYDVLIAAGRDVQASLVRPELNGWRELTRLVHRIEDECREMHARYMRDRAALLAIATRIGAAHARTSAGSGRAAG
jgi:CHAD domain-containing protein